MGIFDTVVATEPSSDPTAESTDGVDPPGSSVQTAGTSGNFLRGKVSDPPPITDVVDNGREVPPPAVELGKHENGLLFVLLRMYLPSAEEKST
jgi:hypothetical protein